jgi:hypothetical protein
MEFGFTFDASEVPESERGEFTPIPANTRVMMQITEADIVPTRSGQGLKFTAEIVEGQYEKRKVWGFINVQNASEEAQKIGQRELADLCLAMGRPQVGATEDLLFAPFEATLGVKADKTYGPKNIIKRYHKPGEVSRAAPQVQQRQAVPAQPATQNKPWKTRAA